MRDCMVMDVSIVGTVLVVDDQVRREKEGGKVGLQGEMLKPRAI